ncbi:PREDICTED: cell adhesion molecule 3-like [Priapulus caudatus]|uniref:Cell adhesion molecule 3-like n=1 Tax=Priapulus caudatus TaxID=37621 RepID=A0ABM1EUV7_PRICU|nr:PREDICTED: cell adhesion molecule 3-like [Priapulus caudatus]
MAAVNLGVVLILCEALVIVKTQFLEQPRDTTAAAGANVTLFCIFDLTYDAGGEEFIQITSRWLRDGTEVIVTNEDRYSYSDAEYYKTGDHSIDIQALQLDIDDAEFYCQWQQQGSLNPESGRISLTVLMEPQSVTISQIANASSPDDTLQFACVSNSSKPAANISWSLNEEDITSDSQATEEPGFIEKTFTTKSILSHVFSSDDDEKTLRCHVYIHDDLTAIDKSETLYLSETVVISSTNKPTSDGVIVLAEQKLVMNCDANGYPEPFYTWMYDDAEYQSTGTINELVIEPIAFQDSGSYSCQATSVFGDYKSTNTMNVIVAVPPEDVTMTMDGDAVEEDSVTLTADEHVVCCTASKGFPEGTVEWQLDGTAIDGAVTLHDSEDDGTVTDIEVENIFEKGLDGRAHKMS